MWHVDEGILNAYLDGELDGQVPGHPDAQEVETHLAQCADCRALLDEVERVRDRASNILASSGPSALETPPFEELRARKEARSQQRLVRQLNRSKVLAWAATIVLAAGVGWFARDAILTRDARQLEAPGSSAATALEPSPDRDLLVEGSLRRFAAAQEREVATGAELPLRTGRRADPSAPLSQPVADEALRQRSIAKMQADAEGRDKALAEDFLASAAEKIEDNRAETEADEQIVSPAAADANVTISRQLDSVPRALFEAAPERRAQIANTEGVSRLSPEPAKFMEGVANREILDDRADLISPWDMLAWDTVTADVAREQWGGPPPQVDGVPVATHAIATMASETAIRVTQLLDGRTAAPVHVISYRQHVISYRQSEPAVVLYYGRGGRGVTFRDFASYEGAFGNASEVTEQRGDYTVVLRGAVPPDSLAALLRKVVPD